MPESDQITMNRLQEKYQQSINGILQKEFNFKNIMAVPRLVKIVVNVGIGEISREKQSLDKAKAVMAALTGQQPSLRSAKKAIAEFKTRQGDIIGLTTVLRGKRMYQFFDKLISLVLPRVRDFNGVKRDAFDDRGNYTLGLREQIIFPEVDYDKIDKVRGLEITIVTTAKDKQKALRLLELFGMPFMKLKNKD